MNLGGDTIQTIIGGCLADEIMLKNKMRERQITLTSAKAGIAQELKKEQHDRATPRMPVTRTGGSMTHKYTFTSFTLTALILSRVCTHSPKSHHTEHYLVTLTLKYINLPVNYGIVEGNKLELAEFHTSV